MAFFFQERGLTCVTKKKLLEHALSGEFISAVVLEEKKGRRA